MGVGESMRNAVTSAINLLNSVIILTPYTISSDDSGHSGQNETDGTPVDELSIPFEELKRITKEKFGDLETGTFQLALKSTAVFEISGDTKYKAKYQGETYDITTPRRYAIDETLVAWILTLTKRTD